MPLSTWRAVALAAAFSAVPMTSAIPMTAAAAAPRKACNMLTDVSGDAYYDALKSQQVSAGNTIDIRSADVATGKKTLVAVLRLTSTARGQTDPSALAVQWTLEFTVGKDRFEVNRRYAYPGEAVPPTAWLSVNGALASGATPTVTVSGNSITWTVQRSQVPALRRANFTVANLVAATTAGTWVTGRDAAPEFGAKGSAVYRDRQPSCVKAS